MAYETFSDSENGKRTETANGAVNTAVNGAMNNGAINPDTANPPQELIAAAPAEGPKRPAGWLSGWRGLAIGLGLGVVVTTIGTHLPSNSHSPAPAVAPSAAAKQTVSVAPAAVTAVTETVSVTGSAAARDMLPILAEASGLQIEQVLVEEGQLVQAGQVLAVLDSSVLKAQLNQARADVVSAEAIVRQKQAAFEQQRATLARAESDLNRYQDLANSGAVSQKDLDAYVTTAKTEREALSVAQANIASAQADAEGKVAEVQKLNTEIEQTIVRAPAAGLIAEKVARVGNVTGTEKLFSLIRAGSLELQAKVPETELPQITVGALARISSDADPRIQLEGRVREIAPLVDAQSRQATVKIDLPSSPLLRSGMFLKAAITVRAAQALTVPAAAVLPQPDGQSLVYVLEGTDTVRAKPVEVGSQDNTDPDKARIVIKRGLQPGDRVIEAGAGYVKDGDRVAVVQP